MNEAQEPKYMIVDEHGVELPNAQLANRKTGGVIPEDEPVMIFRAKDIRTTQMQFLYLETCMNTFHKQAVMARRNQFLAFQASHPYRIEEPD